MSYQRWAEDDAKLETYIYDKNRRFGVPSGTRASNVVLHIGIEERTRPEREVRDQYERDARALAVCAWENRWGRIPWDLTQIMVMHLTVQVLVEVRVEDHP